MTTEVRLASISLRLINSPVRVLVEREGVSDAQWDEIALLVSDEPPGPGRPMLVRPEILLTRRKTLKGYLVRNGIDASADDAVARLLERSKLDDRSVNVALQKSGGRIADVQVSTPNMRRITRPLRPFQSRDLKVLRSLRHGANFSVPGAGKTAVTYALHLHEMEAGRVNALLVVAPLSAFDAWEEEAREIVAPPLRVARWRGGQIPEADVVLVNYQRLPAAQERLTAWMSGRAVHLVVDEAHRAKRGASGGWGRALLSLAPLAARRDILTGTPAPNHPRDLVALMEILWPGGRVSGLLPRRALQQTPPLDAMVGINDAIRPFYVRTNKQELGLPAVDITPVRVRMGPVQAAIYSAMLSRYAGMFDLDRRDSAMFSQMGEVAMYLLQAASSPRLLSTTADPSLTYRYPPLAIPAGSRLAAVVETYNDHEIPTKIAQACAIVRQNALRGSKTLVWSNFPDNLLTLEQQLAAMYPAVIYGGVPSSHEAEAGVRTRERELDRFRNDEQCMVLLANPAAMSEGVSLHHACHDAVYIDRTFNAGQYLQSLDRIHRLGLEPGTSTRITLLIAEGTIDERVDRRVQEKTRRLSRMLADAGLVQMALPDEDDYGDAVGDPADLEEILRHLREAPDQGAE